MKTIQLIEDLKEDLELLGFPLLVAQVDCIKAYYLSEIKPLQPKPKRVIAKKLKEQPLKCEITEAGKTTEVIFQTEKECETFLKLKQKERVSRVQMFLKVEGLTPPYCQYGRIEQYKKESAEYLLKLKNAGLDFNVVISRC